MVGRQLRHHRIDRRLQDDDGWLWRVWEFAPLTASAGQTACDKRGDGNVFVTP